MHVDVHDQVLQHGHVAHRLDLDHAVLGAALGSVEVGVAGERRFAVEADAARAADRLATRAADADRAVEAASAWSTASSTERWGSSSICARPSRAPRRTRGHGAHAQGERLGRPVVRFSHQRRSFGLACISIPSPRAALGDRDRRVAHLGSSIDERDVDVLEPLLVVALGVVGAELSAARLFALERSDHGRLGAVDHVAGLDRAEHVLVEDRSAVIDPGLGRFLFEPRDLPAGPAAGPARRGTPRRVCSSARPARS